MERGSKFSSEFFTKILKRFGACFKLHQPNHAGLGIVGKVLFLLHNLSIDVAFRVKIDDFTSGTNARTLYDRFRLVQVSIG